MAYRYRYRVRRRWLRRRDRRAIAGAVLAGLTLAFVVHAAGTGTGAPAAPAQAAAAPASVSGNVALGQQLASGYGWGAGAEWDCLYALWERESGWNVLATYPSTITPLSAPSSSITTAYGIPQALPAQKMAAAGPGWRADAATQIRWGLGYIRATPGYGTPCGAWAHEEADGWY
jgi:hypothetical protein